MNFQQGIESAQNEVELIKDGSRLSRRKVNVWGFRGEEIKGCETKKKVKRNEKYV